MSYENIPKNTDNTRVLTEAFDFGVAASRINVPEHAELEFRVRSDANNGMVDCQLHFFLSDYPSP